MRLTHTRRALRATALLAVPALLLGACGGDEGDAGDAGTEAAATEADATEADTGSEEPADDETSASGGFSFTDDRGVTVELDEVPDSIVAYTEGGAALVRYGLTPVGMFGASPIADDPIFEGYDISEVESLGSTYGEVDLELMTALDPDLIVSTIFEDPDTDMSQAVLRGFNDLEQQARVEEIAPMVGINAATDAATALERVAELATALGVDVEAEFGEDRTAFEDASAALQAAAEEKSDLTVMAISSFSEQLYIAQPADYADLSYYQELGVPLVVPDSEEPFWQPVSYEQAGLYPADLILYDDRPFATAFDQLVDIPTIGALPAVEADQVGPWRGPAAPLTYGAYAENLQEHADLLLGAEKVTE